MSIYFVDVEADGPCPGLYSMLEIGIVKLTPALDQTFWSTLAPITDAYVQGALDSIGMTREQTLTFDDPQLAMSKMLDFITNTNDGNAVLISDNNGFDAAFVNYYCHRFLGSNPFGFSSRRIGDFYAGLERDWFAGSKWKRLRRTKHTHNALDDAKGNAEAFQTFAKTHGIRVPGL